MAKIFFNLPIGKEERAWNAFCGARIEDNPNTKHAYSEQCGNCLRIVESMPDPDEAENDIKKYFRYVSFNSERNKEVNSK
jgi:hypothetical protein